VKQTGFFRPFQFILAGKVSDDFIRCVFKIIENYGADIVLCDDAYSAVVVLAKSRANRSFVIGRFEVLNKEAGRFFDIISKKAAYCFALVEGGTAKQKAPGRIDTSNTAIIYDKDELLNKIDEQLETALKFGESQANSESRRPFLTEEFHITKEETEALLETGDIETDQAGSKHNEI